MKIGSGEPSHSIGRFVCQNSFVFLLDRIFMRACQDWDSKTPPLYANNLTPFVPVFIEPFGFKPIHLFTDALLFLFAQTLLYIVVYTTRHGC